MQHSDACIHPVDHPIRLAQIGAGYWGPNLIRHFVQSKDLSSFLICDQNQKVIAKVRDQYPGVHVAGDAKAVLCDPEIDAIVLATPAKTHYAMAREALLHGKHVLVEKPLACALTDAEDLVSLAREKGLILMVGHTFLYNDAVRMVKKYIDSGELGDIYYILSQRLNLGRIREDVNAWWNLAPHDVSIILYWLGEMPSKVQCKGMRFLQENIEDVVFANFDFPGGKSAHIHVSWLDPLKTRRMVIVGSKKMLVYDDVATEGKITIYNKGIDKCSGLKDLPDIESYGQFQFMHWNGDIIIPHFKFREPLGVECRHFLECIRNGTPPLTDGQHGLDVVAVLEEAQRCLEAAR